MSLFNKNLLESLKMDELKKEDYILKASIEQIEKEIDQLEKKKKELFAGGVGASQIKKQMIILEIKQTESQLNTKKSEFSSLFKRYTLICNLLTLKKSEKTLEATPVWKKLKGLSSDKLLAMLADVDLAGKKDSEVLDTLNSIFTSKNEREKGALDVDPNDPILAAWSEIEAGNVEIGPMEEEIFKEKKNELN